RRGSAGSAANRGAHPSDAHPVAGRLRLVHAAPRHCTPRRATPLAARHGTPRHGQRASAGPRPLGVS
ncbi:hypothetical protein, partial [Streptomyces hygroscopicus]|uniref:hypothetical protein n=1 Tax=Streptomyces hygroscopicus TaxID=1912 RepID=UPI001961F008